jgi:type II secretory pathway pseudopilin PulG
MIFNSRSLSVRNSLSVQVRLSSAACGLAGGGRHPSEDIRHPRIHRFSRRACPPFFAAPGSSGGQARRLNGDQSLKSTRRAFTLIEMLTTVAVLIIVLGLMVSLARYVRDQSANQLTADLLRNLDAAVRRYADRYAGQLPDVEPLIPDGGGVPDELDLQHRARRNNEEFVHALKQYFAPPRLVDKMNPADKPKSTDIRDAGTLSPQSTDTSSEFGDLPISIYDEVTLRDAWGDPIVFMAHDNAVIGMASRDHPSFFFSAGPDHKYLTRDDNLYSYESAQ